MSEPRSSIETEIKVELTQPEIDLIHSVDFRMNNVLTHILVLLESLPEHPNEPTQLEVFKQFRQFLFERISAIHEANAAFSSSEKISIQQLGTYLVPVSEQLMSFAGAVGQFLRDPSARNAVWMNDTIQDAYARMKPAIHAVGLNPAYRAYKAHILDNALEATRNTFVINA